MNRIAYYKTETEPAADLYSDLVPPVNQTVSYSFSEAIKQSFEGIFQKFICKDPMSEINMRGHL